MVDPTVTDGSVIRLPKSGCSPVKVKRPVTSSTVLVVALTSPFLGLKSRTVTPSSPVHVGGQPSPLSTTRPSSVPAVPTIAASMGKGKEDRGPCSVLKLASRVLKVTAYPPEAAPLPLKLSGLAVLGLTTGLMGKQIGRGAVMA